LSSSGNKKPARRSSAEFSSEKDGSREWFASWYSTIALNPVASLRWFVVQSIQLRKRGTPLIKQDIVHHVIERTGLPRTKAEAAVDTVFEGLKQALTAGERIELRGFGVFSVRARKTGIGRNPRTGTEVSITPGKAVRFKPGKELHTLETGTPAK
jgi:DNA-binding protein HU-beta